MRARIRFILSLILACLAGVGTLAVQSRPPRVSGVFDRREAMIPARDGTKLFIVVLTPKGKGARLPILLRRTAVRRR
jgi:predicted acyl esterase